MLVLSFASSFIFVRSGFVIPIIWGDGLFANYKQRVKNCRRTIQYSSSFAQSVRKYIVDRKKLTIDYNKFNFKIGTWALTAWRHARGNDIVLFVLGANSMIGAAISHYQWLFNIYTVIASELHQEIHIVRHTCRVLLCTYSEMLTTK